LWDPDAQCTDLAERARLADAMVSAIKLPCTIHDDVFIEMV